MPATKIRKLYAYAYNSGADPHAVIIDFEDFPSLTDDWQEVTDAHGNVWSVRKADCGAGCKCAAEARIVSYGHAERVETEERPMPRLAFGTRMAIVIVGDEPDFEAFSDPADALDYLHKRIDADGPKDDDTTAEAKRRAVWCIAACGEESHQMKILWTATTGYRVFKVEDND